MLSCHASFHPAPRTLNLGPVSMTRPEQTPAQGAKLVRTALASASNARKTRPTPGGSAAVPAADGRGTITCAAAHATDGQVLRGSRATPVLSSQLQHKHADHADWGRSGTGVPACKEESALLDMQCLIPPN